MERENDDADPSDMKKKRRLPRRNAETLCVSPSGEAEAFRASTIGGECQEQKRDPFLLLGCTPRRQSAGGVSALPKTGTAAAVGGGALDDPLHCSEGDLRHSSHKQ